MKKDKQPTGFRQKIRTGFRDERQFSKFLMENRDQVLELMSGKNRKERQRYICDSMILMSAVKHTVGRKTPAAQHMVEWVLQEWNTMEGKLKSQIVNEIIDYEKYFGPLDTEWNRELWYQIVNKEILGFLDETL